MRRPAVLALVAAAAVLPAAPAGAAPPERSDVELTFPAGAYCDFPLMFASSSKVKVLEREGSTFVTAADEVATFTDLDTGAELTLHLNGSIRETPLDDGGTLSVATGRNFSAVRGTGITLLVGRFAAVADADGDLVQDFVGSGRRLDVCRQLG